MTTTPSTSAGGGVGDTADAAKESGQAVAGSAADHARDLAGSATDRASDVVEEAKNQAGDLLDTTREQIRSEAETRRGQAVSGLRAVGDELDSMQSHDGDHGVATQLATRGGEYVRQTADWLDGRQPSEILDDVRRFARERPGTFLLGALLAGVVAGRLTRAVKAGPPTAAAVDDPARRQPSVPDPSPISGGPAAVAQGSDLAVGYDIDTDGYPRADENLTTSLPGRPGGPL